MQKFIYILLFIILYKNYNNIIFDYNSIWDKIVKEKFITYKLNFANLVILLVHNITTPDDSRIVSSYMFLRVWLWETYSNSVILWIIVDFSLIVLFLLECLFRKIVKLIKK